MWRAHEFHVQQAFDGDVEGKTRLAGDHIRRRRRRYAVAASVTINRVFNAAHAGNRIIDRPVAGTAAEIALQRPAEVLPLRLIERRRGDDHAGGAEAALKSLRVKERALHRMQLVALTEPLDGRHLAAFGPERGDQATVHRLAIQQHGASAAIAAIAAFLDAEPAELTQEGAQALAGGGPVGKVPPVDP